MGPVHKNFNIPNPTSEGETRKLNALFQMTNCCFCPVNVSRLKTVNDNKKRHDFEEAKGKGPTEEFWKDMSETTNDASFNDTLKDIVGPETNEHMTAIALIFDLSDFDQGTHKTVKQNMRDLLRARGDIAKAKKRSGNHHDDTTECPHEKFLKVGKDMCMPEEAVCHLDLRCQEHTSIDQAHTEALKESHKSDSTAVPGNDEEDDGTAGAKGNKQKDFMVMLEKSNENPESVTLQAKSSRQEERHRLDWDSHISACESHLELRHTADVDDAASERVIANPAKRILSLEKELGVPDKESAAKEVLP